MKGLQDAARFTKHALRVFRGRDVWQSAQIKCDRLTLGNQAASWCICPRYLSTSSVVYSIGVGEDISFDLALIQQFGLQVHAFDPTPKCIEWLQGQTLPPGFVFHAHGVAGFDGSCAFMPPENPSHVSHTIMPRSSSRPAIEVSMHRLGTIKRMLGHACIDLLKMDIEGAEYDVIADMLTQRIPVKQLLVEFHHRWPQVGVDKTKRAICKLNAAGYRVFDVAPSGEEYSFLLLSIQ
jgi:FkbM family methyltransferase